MIILAFLTLFIIINIKLIKYANSINLNIYDTLYVRNNVRVITNRVETNTNLENKRHKLNMKTSKF